MSTQVTNEKVDKKILCGTDTNQYRKKRLVSPTKKRDTSLVR